MMLKWRPLARLFTTKRLCRKSAVKPCQHLLPRAQTVSTTEEEDPDLRHLKSNKQPDHFTGCKEYMNITNTDISDKLVLLKYV